MKNVYACLLGHWVNLSADKECLMGEYRQSPYIWLEEGAEIWTKKDSSKNDTFTELDYIWMHYQGKSYRINPIFIQIVEE